MAKRLLVDPSTTTLLRLDETAVADVTSGLVARWKMDDNLATTVVLDDVSTHDGTLQGGNNTQDLSVGAPMVRGLDLDGSADYVRVPYNAAFEVAAVTVSAWVRVDSYSVNWFKVFSFPYRSDGSWIEPYGSYFLHRYNNTSQFAFAVATGGTYQQVIGATQLSVGVWHHLLGTYDGTDIKIYVDGRLDGVLNAPSTIQYDGGHSPDIAIGQRSPYSAGEYFNGAIDDTRLYNRAVTAAEAKQIHDHAVWSRDLGPDRVQWVKEGTSPIAVTGQPFTTALQFTRASSERLYTTSDAVKTPALTFECWFNLDSLPPSPDDVMFFAGVYNLNGWYCGVRNVAGVQNLIFYTGSELQTPMTGVSTGEWHHFCVTVDSGTKKMYLDGVLVAEAAGTTVTYTAGGIVAIGAVYDANGATWTGHVDGKLAEVMFCDEAQAPWKPFAVANAVKDLAVPGFGVDADTVLCFNFNDANDGIFDGDTVYDDAGNHNGTVDGGGQWLTPFCPIGDLARWFDDNSGGGQSLVRVLHHVDFTAANDITLECWFSPELFDNLRFIVGKTQVNGNGFHISQKYLDGDVLQMGIGNPTQSVGWQSGQNFLVAGRWYYAALTWDVANFTGRFYVDGQLVGSATNTNIVVATHIDNTYDFCVGGDDSNTDYEYQGFVAAVRFSNRRRTSKEIYDYYQGTNIQEIG